MKTDIQIAQEAIMEPIVNVAEALGITADDLELYGKYKAKISDEYLKKIENNKNGKLILVTAINPTPAGEGKTTTTSTGSVTTTTTEPIIVKVNGEESPLVLKETLPEIKGVIVVSSGASDVKIKLDIITAVTTVLGIDSNKVEVFVGI